MRTNLPGRPADEARDAAGPSSGGATGRAPGGRAARGSRAEARRGEFLALAAGGKSLSRATFHIHSFPVILLSRKPPETQGKRPVFGKNDGWVLQGPPKNS